MFSTTLWFLLTAKTAWWEAEEEAFCGGGEKAGSVLLLVRGKWVWRSSTSPDPKPPWRLYHPYTEALSKRAGVETPCLYWEGDIQEISGGSSLLADRISCRHSSTTRLLRIGLAIPVKNFFHLNQRLQARGESRNRLWMHFPTEKKVESPTDKVCFGGFQELVKRVCWEKGHEAELQPPTRYKIRKKKTFKYT